MPQLIALALVGVGVYAGYRYVANHFRQRSELNEKRAMENQRAAAPQEIGELEWDAEAGVYRPRRN
jgi:hypothetical protein